MAPLLKVLKDTVAELALAVDGRVLVVLTRGACVKLALPLGKLSTICNRWCLFVATRQVLTGRTDEHLH